MSVITPFEKLACERRGLKFPQGVLTPFIRDHSQQSALLLTRAAALGGALFTRRAHEVLWESAMTAIRGHCDYRDKGCGPQTGTRQTISSELISGSS